MKKSLGARPPNGLNRRTAIAGSAGLAALSGASLTYAGPLDPKADLSFVNPAGLRTPRGYSQMAVIRSGRLVFFAGQTPVGTSGEVVGPGDFRAQLEQVFSNLDIGIRSVGGTFSNIIKLNYYCAESVDPALLRHVNEVRDRFTNTTSPPISTFVFVSRLARPEWLIEIEAVGVLPE
ncbi:RidA family protein [Brevundimonas naejangsanensis]|uniref:RidA family protein n=1 Tax=Brevundimonas naejangsanensis TaxID=588932 RepID=UPI000688B21D|nr:RidA family protein [Brevundimonas naejangsanensis]